MYLILGDLVLGFELKCLQFCAFGPTYRHHGTATGKSLPFFTQKNIKKLTLKGSALKFLFTLDL